METAAELQSALSDAAGNGDVNTIRVCQGIYTGNFSFISTLDTGVAVVGGYAAGCLSRVDDPGGTVLDGNGSGTPLSFTKNGDGSVVVVGLSLLNGGYRGLYFRLYNDHSGNVGSIFIQRCVIAGNGPRGGIYIASSDNPAYVPGAIQLDSNVISGNVGDYGGAGLSIQAQWNANPSDIILRNNLIVGNLGSDVSGGVFINAGSETRVYLVNNTVADNHAITTVSDAGGVYINNVAGSSLYIYNNIVRGNSSTSGVADIWFYDFGTARIGHNNDYHELHGTWTEAVDNIDVDPHFLDPGYWEDNGTPGIPADDFWVDGDYHLLGMSACIDAGDGASPELPSLDIDGDPRAVDGDGDGTAQPDVGADEFAGDCLADTDADGDVDGSDLQSVIAGTFSLDPSVIAAEFGRVNCL